MSNDKFRDLYEVFFDWRKMIDERFDFSLLTNYEMEKSMLVC